MTSPLFGGKWSDRAACIGSWDLFDENLETGEYLDKELAFMMCAMCPVFKMCKKAGENEISGIWAGEVK